MSNSTGLNPLLERVRQGIATREDFRELRALIDADKEGFVIRAVHAFHSVNAGEVGQDYDPLYWQGVLEEILAVDKEGLGDEALAAPVRRLPWRWGRWRAAAVLLLMAVGVYVWRVRMVEPRGIVASKPADVAPGGNKAVLTLSNGQRVMLDSAVDGMLAVQGNVQVRKQPGGRLVYLLSGTASRGITGKGKGDVLYNTLSAPRGGQYQLTLSDGTKVWLDAASSITYPATFSAGAREVRITGEAYFEVAGNPAAPFRVVVADRSVVEVLGTSFNINAYTDEPVVRTTLVGGSVRIWAGQGRGPAMASIVLKPGQQVIRPQDEPRLELVEHADVDQALAWKNGLFDFNGAGLAEVMKQLQRWYDLDVVYEQGVPDIRFGGEMSRNVPLSALLAGLKDMKVRFRIEAGRRLVVSR